MNNVSQHAISSYEWVTPPELGQSIPRKITMTKSVVFLSVFLSIIGFLIFIIIQIAFSSYTHFYHLENLNVKGVRAEGIVIKLSSLQIKGRRPRMGYFVTYNYMTRPQSDEDKILTGNDEIEQALFAGLRVGYRIPVIYDPQNPIDSIQNVTGPARFRKNRNDSIFLTVPVLLFILLTSLMIWIFFSTLRVTMRTRELLKYGSVASATIIKEEIKSAGKGQSITLTYQFVDSEGNVVESISKSLPAGDDPLAVARRLAVTSNPTVLFDPRNSSHSLLYPPSGPRCVPRNVNF